MAGEQGSEGSKELTAWLVANDAKTRARRSTRLRDLLDILLTGNRRVTALLEQGEGATA